MATPLLNVQPPFEVRAIAPYQARNGSEVSLEVGKTYLVLQTDGRGLWWQTKTEDGAGVGWFPASYTEILAAAPVAPQPAPPAPVVVPQAQASYSTASPMPSAGTTSALPSTASVGAVSVSSTERPQPLKLNVEKSNAPCHVILHLIRAKELVSPKPPSPTAFVYKLNVMDKKIPEKPLFKTPERKKTNAPEWNEAYQLFIKDAESEIVVIRICNGKSLKEKLIGEVEFALRGAVRKFDKPNGITTWFPLKGGKEGKEKMGEVFVFIEFVDTRATEGPKNVKHEGHVGISATGGFEIRDIPAEWKQLFKLLHIKKKDLENNPDYANEVFDVMQKHGSDAAAAVSSLSAVTDAGAGTDGGNGGSYDTMTGGAGYTSGMAPEPPRTSMSSQPPPPPPAPVMSTSAPPPPPPPVSRGPAPPPPPAMGGPRAPPPPAPSGGGGAPHPPPAAPVSGGGGGGGWEDIEVRGGSGAIPLVYPAPPVIVS
eukprot:TRINITY_DN18259_c0_g1_i1.p1 TRINITY_DN18259_c0_g1~~TRINITY_DN18259_c0_g1_i1.p1  ORF type:complete len:482 (-),score=88.61 TRINITY_DN18259_c0_g1_i1:1279-2724(-)